MTSEHKTEGHKLPNKHLKLKYSHLCPAIN